MNRMKNFMAAKQHLRNARIINGDGAMSLLEIKAYIHELNQAIYYLQKAKDTHWSRLQSWFMDAWLDLGD